VIPALLVFSRSEQLPLDIGARLKPAKLGEARSGTASSALLARLRFGQGVRGAAGPLLIAVVVFGVVSVLGAATSYLRGWPQKAAGSVDTISESSSPYRADGELLGNLKDYAGSIGAEEPSPSAAPDKLLPDVNTMIERLAARLETTPKDVQGWRTLGWSYVNTGRYEQAAIAYARAVELDPNSAEIKLAYEEAKSKASEGGHLETVSSARSEVVGEGGNGLIVETATTSETTPPHESDAAIRSMVDGLADRLESSPQDVEGWTRLMRSRVVLGEREVAATAFRKALDVFKDDSAASAKIAAAATELGLKAE
jgi:cytochrome c-type biogenesis protein CcmH